MTQCDRALAGASRNSQLPSGMSWAQKKGLELWMEYLWPDIDSNLSICQLSIPVPNVDINWFFNHWPR